MATRGSPPCATALNGFCVKPLTDNTDHFHYAASHVMGRTNSILMRRFFRSQFQRDVQLGQELFVGVPISTNPANRSAAGRGIDTTGLPLAKYSKQHL